MVSAEMGAIEPIACQLLSNRCEEEKCWLLASSRLLFAKKSMEQTLSFSAVPKRKR